MCIVSFLITIIALKMHMQADFGNLFEKEADFGYFWGLCG